MTAPLISVIVPTANRPNELSKCLDSLSPSAQSIDAASYEVIVTDDGNLDSDIRDKFPWAIFTLGPKRGAASNRNSGAKIAKGSWLVFIDDDCIADPKLLKAYEERIGESEVLEGKVSAERERVSLLDAAPINETGGYLWSCNMAIEKKLFNELEGFCELFPYPAMEDIEFRCRLKKRGISPLFVPSAKVTHPWRDHPGASYCKAHKESTLILLALHPEEKKNISASYFIKAFVRGLIYSTIPGFFKFRGRGIKNALRLNLYNLDMALTLLLRREKKREEKGVKA